MASVELRATDVYSVVQLEKVMADFTGQGIMQEATMDSTNFATELLENGQCVIVVGNTIKNPTGISSKVLLNATPCELYEVGKGRETFAVDRTAGSNPRLLAINAYDEISTNACFYDDTEFTTLALLKTAITAGTVYAVPDATRDWKLTATTTDAVVIGEVLEYITLSNDRDGVRIRFQ
jgi:hypothetical protein